MCSQGESSMSLLFLYTNAPLPKMAFQNLLNANKVNKQTPRHAIKDYADQQMSHKHWGGSHFQGNINNLLPFWLTQDYAFSGLMIDNVAFVMEL